MATRAPQVQKKLSEYAIKFLKDLPMPADHDELIGKGQEFIKKLSHQ